MSDSFDWPNALSENPKIAQYFYSLPAFVQETLMQAGNITSESELYKCAENLMDR